MLVFQTFANCIEWNCTESIICKLELLFFTVILYMYSLYCRAHTKHSLNSEIVQEEFDRKKYIAEIFRLFFFDTR